MRMATSSASPSWQNASLCCEVTPPSFAVAPAGRSTLSTAERDRHGCRSHVIRLRRHGHGGAAHALVGGDRRRAVDLLHRGEVAQRDDTAAGGDGEVAQLRDRGRRVRVVDVDRQGLLVDHDRAGRARVHRRGHDAADRDLAEPRLRRLLAVDLDGDVRLRGREVARRTARRRSAWRRRRPRHPPPS